MEAETYLQMIMAVFIIIVLILVFVLYSEGSRANNNRPAIIGPGGTQQVILGPDGPRLVNTPQRLIVAPVFPSQPVLSTSGTQWFVR